MNIRRAVSKRLLPAAMIGVLASAVSVYGQLSFSRLGVTTGLAVDVSKNGSVVAIDAGRAIRWTRATGPIDLGTLPTGQGANATSMSADGSVIVGNSGTAPFRWTMATGMIPLVYPASASSAAAWDISGAGHITVGEIQNPTTTGTVDAVRWIGTNEPQSLGSLGGGNISAAYAISTDGSTVVGYAATPDRIAHAFRWTETEGLVDLGLPSQLHSLAQGVSADGTFIVGNITHRRSINNTEGFLWSEEQGTVSLGLFGHSTFPRAVSADGSLVIGIMSAAGIGGGGFIWTPNSGIRDFLQVLNDDYDLGSQIGGWTNLIPSAMSDDARYIVGWGTIDGSANFDAWLLDRGMSPPPIDPLTPVPEPSLFGLLGAALLAGALLRRHLYRFIRWGHCPPFSGASV